MKIIKYYSLLTNNIFSNKKLIRKMLNFPADRAITIVLNQSKNENQRLRRLQTNNLYKNIEYFVYFYQYFFNFLIF